MRSQRETLDETINRVAVVLTSAADSPALTARIAQRIRTETHGGVWLPRWNTVAFALAGAAAVIVAVVISTAQRPREQTQSTQSSAGANPTAQTHPPAAATRPAQIAQQIGTQTQMQPRRDRSITHSLEVPQIAALPSPSVLAVDGIAPDPLTVSPVELAPLDLANLALTESDRGDDPKE